MNFIKPMYTNQKYISKFEIIEVLPKNKFWVMTTISDTNKEITIDGKALIKILQ